MYMEIESKNMFLKSFNLQDYKGFNDKWVRRQRRL